MREVKVPDFMQPFEVIVNGVKHVFPAGETVTVEDSIADIIEQSVPPKAEAKVERVMWEDIGNRPFYESETGGDTLTWDGNTEGLVYVEAFGAYKIADATPTLEEASGGTFTMVAANGENTSLPIAEYANDVGYGIWAVLYMLIVPETAVGVELEEGVVLTESGTYAMIPEGESITSLSLYIPNYTGFPAIKKIDEKFLPLATFLYCDDTYLYHSADVTNEANRVTSAELKAMVTSGMSVVLKIISSDNEAFLYPLLIQITNEGVGAVACIEKALYTAEYTPT